MNKTLKFTSQNHHKTAGKLGVNVKEQRQIQQMSTTVLKIKTQICKCVNIKIIHLKYKYVHS